MPKVNVSDGSHLPMGNQSVRLLFVKKKRENELVLKFCDAIFHEVFSNNI